MSIVKVTLAYIIGIKWGLYQDVKVLVGLSFFVLIFTHFFKKNKFIVAEIFVIICLVGAIYSNQKFKYMETKYNEGVCEKYVTVITNKNVSANGYSYKYTIKDFNGDKFLLYIKANEKNIFDIGYKLRVFGEFDKPEKARNSGGFDFQKYIYSNNIYGTIICENAEVLSKNTKNLIYIIQNKIRLNMLKIFDEDVAGVLIGMLIGETNDISKSVQENFKTSGVTHLLAVSGANVMLIISISNFLFSKLVGRKYDYLVLISFIIIFSFIAGASPSVIRAAIMAITNIILNLLLKKSNPIYNLSFSVLLITIYNPISAENIGLILSAFGTLGIILLSKDFDAFLAKYLSNKLIKETLSVTLSAQIFLIPIMAYYFNNFSLISIFSNLIIVPFAEILSIVALVVFLISLISLELAKWISILPTMIVKYILFAVKFCSELKLLNFIVPTPKILIIIVFYLIVFLENKSWKLKHSISNLNYEIKILKYVKKIFYIALTIGFSVMFLIDLIPKNFIQLNAIDVGQGDSFLLTTTHQKQILIDGGGSENGNYDVGENVLLPYMLDRGITTIDYIFLSHAHADHIEGIYTLIKNIKVKQIFITSHSINNAYMSQLKSLCAKYKVPIKEIYKGDKLNIDGIYFEVLYPSRVDTDSNENNLSMLLKVIANNTTLLFTGDLEKEVEEKILDMNINADILKVSHHGSKTSTTKKFLDRVNPRISIISVAEDNSFGHPNQDVVESLLDTSKVYMTKDLGEIRFQIYKNGIIKFDSQLKNETP